MDSPSVAVRELPLFPLPELVLFPGRQLPLHIFELRYRMLMNTILQGDRRFGVLMIDPSTGEIAKVGCCAEIIHYQRTSDDRMKIMTLGQQRFRVLDYVRETPYRVGLVEWIEDDPTEESLEPLANEVDQLLRDVVRLSGKLTSQEIKFPKGYASATSGAFLLGGQYASWRFFRAAVSARDAEHTQSFRARGRDFDLYSQ